MISRTFSHSAKQRKYFEMFYQIQNGADHLSKNVSQRDSQKFSLFCRKR